MCPPKSQAMLWSMHLIHPIVWIFFGITYLDFQSNLNQLSDQCGTSSDVVDNTDNNCPTDWNSPYEDRCTCASFGERDGYWEPSCEIPFNSSNCDGWGWSCECDSSIQLDTLAEVYGYMLLGVFAFFELIKLLIIWRLSCIISEMRRRPKIHIDSQCLKCGIKSLGNSCWLRCIMCNKTGKSFVLYMYHRGMLLKNCGCCCLFFWQTMFGCGILFTYGYAFSIGIVYNFGLSSPGLWYITLGIECLWILVQMVYCASPVHLNDDDIKEEIAKYNLPTSFANDIVRPIPTPQQIPLQVQQPQVVMVPQQPQVLYVQQQANGQMVYVQPQQPQQPQQVVVMQQPPQPLPQQQPTPAMSVASYSHGGSLRNLGTGAGGADYQIANPSAPGLDDNAHVPPPYANPSAPPPMNPEANAPPAYHDYMNENNNGPGGEGGGNRAYPNLEGGARAETHQ